MLEDKNRTWPCPVLNLATVRGLEVQLASGLHSMAPQAARGSECPARALTTQSPSHTE